MKKPNRHIWEEGSTHRSIAGDEYDEIWDYAEQLEVRLQFQIEANDKLNNRRHELEDENERLWDMLLEHSEYDVNGEPINWEAEALGGES